MRKVSIFAAIVIASTVASGTTYARAASPDVSQLASSYANFCTTHGVEQATPAGESDLKGNPKLGSYCACFGRKFAERAAVRLQHPDAAPRPARQIMAETHAMRNGCRSAMGLPLLTFAK